MSPPPSFREVILDAAEAVVFEAGASHMTLDAVAAKAGVSKGGLLYHFPTKEALLKAMLHRHVQHIKEIQKKKRTELKEGPGLEIKAFILSQTERDHKTNRVSGALLAAVAHNPRLLESTRDDFRKHLADFTQSGLRFERAAVIAFAVNGLLLSELLSLSPLNVTQRKQVIGELFRLADEGIQKCKEQIFSRQFAKEV
jgi:AcrR family transcriptional regulator